MKTIATCCLAVLASAAPAAASAQSEPLDIRQNYSGTSSMPVFNIATYNSYANGPGISNSFSIDAGAFSFDDPFLKSSANPPLSTYFLGVASYSSALISGAASSVTDAVSPDVIALPQHLVLAVSSTYAAGLISGGQDFSTIFPTYDENSLINDLNTIGSNSGNSADAAVSAAYGELFDFGATIQSRNGLTPAAGGPLSLLSFSGATLVGQGTAILVPLGGMTPAVPEPATWVMMIVGLGAIGFSMRSAKRRSDEKFDAKIKRITVAGATVTRLAAARQLIPSSTAASARDRRSIDNGLPIHASLHPASILNQISTPV